MSSPQNEKQGLAPIGARSKARREMRASTREVSLARLLLQLIDTLGTREDMDVNLYNEVKSISEPLVREVPDGD